MKKENMETECCKETNCCGEMAGKKYYHHRHHHYNNGSSNAIYGLGVVGALFYFLGGATSFGMVLLGIGKSIFWPAILMFKLLTYLGM